MFWIFLASYIEIVTKRVAKANGFYTIYIIFMFVYCEI